MLLYYCTYPIVLQAACSRAPAAQMSAAKAAIALAAAVAGAATPQNLFSRAARAQISEKKFAKVSPEPRAWSGEAGTIPPYPPRTSAAAARPIPSPRFGRSTTIPYPPKIPESRAGSSINQPSRATWGRSPEGHPRCKSDALELRPGGHPRCYVRRFWPADTPTRGYPLTLSASMSDEFGR